MPYAHHRPNTFLFFLLLLSLLLAPTWDSAWAKDGPHYRYQQPSRDGIGKVYLGREISQVMGHRGAGWLERKHACAKNAPIVSSTPWPWLPMPRWPTSAPAPATSASVWRRGA
jgi:hypothetical protein